MYALTHCFLGGSAGMFGGIFSVVRKSLFQETKLPIIILAAAIKYNNKNQYYNHKHSSYPLLNNEALTHKWFNF